MNIRNEPTPEPASSGTCTSADHSAKCVRDALKDFLFNNRV